MLAGELRIRDGEDFRRVFRAGRRAGAEALVVHLVDPPRQEERCVIEAGPARAGFVVSKAVGSAVTRNRVKRRLRHLVRDLLPRLAPGSALVVRALPASSQLSSAELGRQLDRCLERVRQQVPGRPSKAVGSTAGALS